MVLKNLLTGQQWRNIENGLVDMGSGEERARVMERVTQKLTLPHVKIDSRGNLLHGSGNSKELCFNLEGWGGGQGSSKGRGYMYTYG